jgi:hypothetical protein
VDDVPVKAIWLYADSP